MTRTAFEGSCHCQALGFTYHTRLPAEQWSVRACQCTFCTAHAALSTSDPRGLLEFRIRDERWLRRYRFGLGTADFLLCAQCGVYMGAQIDTERGAFGIINLRALRGRPATLAAAAPVDYGAEGAEERVQRRAKQWTPIATRG
jgi:hypothetical protein